MLATFCALKIIHTPCPPDIYPRALTNACLCDFYARRRLTATTLLRQPPNKRPAHSEWKKQYFPPYRKNSVLYLYSASPKKYPLRQRSAGKFPYWYKYLPQKPLAGKFFQTRAASRSIAILFAKPSLWKNGVSRFSRGNFLIFCAAPDEHDSSQLE